MLYFFNMDAFSGEEMVMGGLGRSPRGVRVILSLSHRLLCFCYGLLACSGEKFWWEWRKARLLDSDLQAV
ncbi:hypothetical protein H6P81_005856 [Aristolochia fimbriata]|uniref:Uncharacterized protein n=1 Tax=Aristolochia fimbriata TaxID=158543 RepID=A0AAV7EZ73_ARIFI|nr:hypothetical protein H6P81_005856 [Aristolochia fimbriata]